MAVYCHQIGHGTAPARLGVPAEPCRALYAKKVAEIAAELALVAHIRP